MSEKIKLIHKQPFNPAQNKKTFAYEPIFLNKDEKYVHPFLGNEDPYEATKDSILMHKWMEEAKILHGDFKPSGPQKPIATIQRNKMQDIVEVLKKLLLADWNDVNFVIGTNPQDYIEVKFDLGTLDTL